jgi:hypothetical protein
MTAAGTAIEMAAQRGGATVLDGVAKAVIPANSSTADMGRTDHAQFAKP